MARLSAFCSAGDACCFLKPLSAVCRASVIPSALKKNIYSQQHLRHAFVGGLSKHAVWVRKPRGPLIGWVNSNATAPPQSSTPDCSSSVRPQPLYTDAILKMQATLGLNRNFFLLRKWGRVAVAFMLPLCCLYAAMMLH